jgi:hypothetical protein
MSSRRRRARELRRQPIDLEPGGIVKMAKFGDEPTRTERLLHNANIISATGIEGECSRAVAGIEALLVPCGKTAAPHWLIICPFSRELPPDGRSRMLDRLNGALGGVLTWRSWTPSWPCSIDPIKLANRRLITVVSGRRIDLCDDLDATAIGRPRRGGSQ